MRFKKAIVVLTALTLLLSLAPTPLQAKATTKSKARLTVSVVTKKRAKLKGKKLVTYKGKKARIRVKYGSKTVTTKVKYKTSNKKIFTISKKGIINPKKLGSAVLTIMYTKKTVKLRVYVKNASKQQTNCTSHTWKKTKTTTAPTCQKTGVDLYTCSKCGKTKNVTTAKTDHVYVNHICKYCGHCNIAKVNPTITPPSNRWPYAGKLFSPDACPQHFWEYDHCFYCNKPNPQPGVLKGWDMNKKADHEHEWEGVYGVNAYGQLIATADGLAKHRCKLCGIDEPYIWTERCNKCPIVWSTLEHADEKDGNGIYITYSVHDCRVKHQNADPHPEGASLAEGKVFVTDAYFLYSTPKRSVYNPLYMQSNLTGKTVWDKLGLAGKVWGAYNTSKTNSIYHYTENCWVPVPDLVNW